MNIHFNGCIYKATNKLNEKIYVGQTSYSLHRRKQIHLSKHTNYKSYFHSSLLKNLLNFEWDILVSVSTDSKEKLKRELDYLEKFYILYFKSKVPNGYNLTDGGGGCLGTKMSEERRLISSKTMKQTNKLYPHIKIQAIKNITSSEAKMKHLLYARSDETRKIRSNNIKGDKNPMRRFPEKNPFRRPEIIEKLKIQRIGVGNPMAKEYNITYPSGKKEKIKCLREFCKKNNITKYMIYAKKNGWDYEVL